MIKNVLALCVVFSTNVYALDVISEDDLSAISAQDGISVLVALPAAGWKANEVSLTDTNGINASIVAGYATAGTIVATTVGFNACANAACTTAGSIKFDVDMVGDHNGVAVGGGAMLNMAFSLTGGATKMRFYIDDIRLRNGPSGINEVVLVDFLQNHVDVTPIGSSTLFAVQLGNESLGHMLHFTNGNFGTIDFGTVAFLDKQTPTNSLRFGFKLDEFDITDTGFDINLDGLVYTAADFGKSLMDITLSDIKMGGAAAASIGSIGIQNLKVTNLVLTISGKS